LKKKDIELNKKMSIKIHDKGLDKPEIIKDILEKAGFKFKATNKKGLYKF